MAKQKVLNNVFLLLQGHLHLNATGDLDLPLGELGLLRCPHAKRNISLKRGGCGQFLNDSSVFFLL